MNNYSLILLLEYRGTRILLPGGQTRVTLPKSFLGDAGSIAVRGVSAYGAQGPAAAARR